MISSFQHEPILMSTSFAKPLFYKSSGPTVQSSAGQDSFCCSTTLSLMTHRLQAVLTTDIRTATNEIAAYTSGQWLKLTVTWSHWQFGSPVWAVSNDVFRYLSVPGNSIDEERCMPFSAKILQIQIWPFKLWWWKTIEIDYTVCYGYEDLNSPVKTDNCHLLSLLFRDFGCSFFQNLPKFCPFQRDFPLFHASSSPQSLFFCRI